MSFGSPDQRDSIFASFISHIQCFGTGTRCLIIHTLNVYLELLEHLSIFIESVKSPLGFFKKWKSYAHPLLNTQHVANYPKVRIVITGVFLVRNEPPHVDRELNISSCSPQHWIDFHNSAHTGEHPMGPVAEEQPCLWQG